MSRSPRSAALLTAIGLFAGLFAATTATAQDPAAAARRLLQPGDAPRALAELRRAGAAGAVAVFDAFDAAATAPAVDAVAAARLARALAELGTATAAVTPRLLAAIRAHGEPLRSHLLRALANGALVADPDAQAAIAAALPGMLEAGLLFSPAADAPTFAWYEYVRLKQRLSLAADGDARVMNALNQLAANRGGLVFLGGPFAGPVPNSHDLNAFGSHGQRELLEGAAELAWAAGEHDNEAAIEFARYLENETPRPGIVLTEHCAGIGEHAPPDVPATQFPTLWRRDDWRFACARAVFARHPDANVRQHALRHLLYCDDVALRIEAIEAVRSWPPPWDAFAADLAACLDASERAVVREALVTLGLAGAPVDAAMAAIERLASGPDAELAAMARRLLRDRTSGRAQRGR